jgi:hypothetical protein
MIGLMFERQVYLAKLGLIERLGTHNNWDPSYPLLPKLKEILYQENEDFELVDYNPSE